MIKTRKEKMLEARIAKLERKLNRKNESSFEQKKAQYNIVLSLVKQLDEFDKLNRDARNFAEYYSESQAEDDWYDDDGVVMDDEIEALASTISGLLSQFVEQLDYNELASTIIYDHINEL